MPMYYSPPTTPTAVTAQPRSPFLPRSRSHSFSHPSSSSSTPSSSRSRNTSTSHSTRTGSSTSTSNNTNSSNSTNSSRTRSTSTTSTTSSTSKPTHSSSSKTPYVFLGSIAAASWLAHTYWPRGYPHGEKEDWELSGLARRARDRRAAEKRADKAQARAVERGRKVEREVAEGQGHGKGRGQSHGRGQSQRGRSTSAGGEACDCGYAGERGRCEREKDMRGGKREVDIVEEYYRSRPQRRVSFAADTTAAAPAKRGPYGGAYHDEVYRARDAHVGTSSRRSRSHTRDREHEGRYVEYHAVPKRYIVVDPADRWAPNPSRPREAVSGYGFGHGEQKLVVGRQRRGSVGEKVVWDGGYNGTEWR